MVRCRNMSRWTIMHSRKKPGFRPILDSMVPKAVALKYDESLPAPFLVAKGAGSVAERMRDLAEELNIPILRDSDLSGFLFPFDPGQMVPEAYWEMVAKVYVFIAELERR